MSKSNDTTPALIVEAGKTTPPKAYYAAAWHEPKPGGGTKPAKKRIGEAWLDYAGPDELGRPTWSKRKGRVAEGHYDERRAHAAAPGIVAAWRAAQVAKATPANPADSLTVRQLAHEWLAWFVDVKGGAPSTAANYRNMLRDPEPVGKRADRIARGRLMGEFGDRLAKDVSIRDVAAWLRKMDKDGLSPRTVNQYRQVLRNVYVYGRRHDTYGLEHNPVDATDARRTPPLARLDFYEVEEVEALARACSSGAYRAPRGRDRPEHDGPAEAAQLTRQQMKDQAAAVAMRAQLDRQDGDLFRVLFYSGLRIGEILALRWRDVEFLPDMSGGVLDVRNAVSAGSEKPPKSWQPRTVPLPRPAVEALARVQQRQDFVGPDDYVFVSVTGGRLNYSALRRRYHAARTAAGLRNVKLHGLRHAAGSIMAASMPIVAVRDVLGHAQLATTNRYLHGKTDARAVAAMNAAYGVTLEQAPPNVPAEPAPAS